MSTLAFLGTQELIIDGHYLHAVLLGAVGDRRPQPNVRRTDHETLGAL